MRGQTQKAAKLQLDEVFAPYGWRGRAETGV